MLKANQYAVIDRMARGLSMHGAAEAVGTTERSVRRWRDDPEFAAELRDATASVREEVAMTLNAQTRLAQWMTERAINRLDEIVHVKDVAASTRACQIMLNHGVKMNLIAAKIKDQHIAEPDTNGVKLPATVDPVPQASDGATDASRGSIRDSSVQDARQPGETGQNRTFFPDAKGLGKSEQSAAHAQNRTSPDMPCATAGSSSSSANAEENSSHPEKAAVTTNPSASSHGQLAADAGVSGGSTSKSNAAPLDRSNTAARVTPAPAAPAVPPSSHVQVKPAPNPDESGQNRTFFPDAKGLSDAEPPRAAGQTEPSPESDGDDPAMPASDKHYPRTPEEFAEDARELEKLAQEARAAGDAEGAREIARDAHYAWKKAGIKDAS